MTSPTTPSAPSEIAIKDPGIDDMKPPSKRDHSTRAGASKREQVSDFTTQDNRMFILHLTFLSACVGRAVDLTAAEASAQACERVGESAGTLPRAETTTNAVVLPVDGEPYTALLADAVPSYLAVQIDTPTAAILFAGAANVVSAIYDGEESVGLPSPSPDESCPEDIPEAFDLDFDAAGTWYIQLGPATVTEVWLALTPVDPS